jgi:hypothetical protein
VPAALSMKFVERLLYTKFSHWRYEQEYRAFVNLETSVGDHYYMGFSRDLRLKRVIVGDQSAISRRDVTDAIQGSESEVEVFRARAAFRTFEVVRNRNESMWA